jgi:flagella basal body P-ring formation protein FlgA
MKNRGTRTRLALLAAAMLALTVRASGETEFVPVEQAIRQAVLERLGDVEVEILSIDRPAGGASSFRAARPDPAGRLGRPVRFTLVPDRGPLVFATVTLRVVGEHVVTLRELSRGATVAADDVRQVRAELMNVPLRRLPTGEQVVGSRVLRPIRAQSTVLPGAVAVRRAIEPGDRVTVLAVSGAIRVSAMLTAADGGDPGDVIRVVNRDSRRTLRGRVVKEGLVEVRYGR